MTIRLAKIVGLCSSANLLEALSNKLPAYTQYAGKLQRKGLIALKFDTSYQGVSERSPRHSEDPFTHAKDISDFSVDSWVGRLKPHGASVPLP